MIMRERESQSNTSFNPQQRAVTSSSIQLHVSCVFQITYVKGLNVVGSQRRVRRGSFHKCLDQNNYQSPLHDSM